jgi:hypothetical protein
MAVESTLLLSCHCRIMHEEGHEKEITYIVYEVVSSG